MQSTWIGAHENNYEKGRRGSEIGIIICHWIAGSLEACDRTFQDPNRRASAHYGVANGTIHQYVKETDTAYHAGDYGANLSSIGIEHEGGPSIEITAKTYETSGKLIAAICRRYNIPIDKDHILPHHKFRATQCPGTLDINRLINVAQQMYATPQQPVQTVTEATITIPVSLNEKHITKGTSLNTIGQYLNYPQDQIDQVGFGDRAIEKIRQIQTSYNVLYDYVEKHKLLHQQTGGADSPVLAPQPPVLTPTEKVQRFDHLQTFFANIMQSLFVRKTV